VIRSLATSPDGQWAIARQGREVVLLAAGAAPALGKIDLTSDDVDLAIVNGPPNVVIAATRDASSTQIVLHYPPELDAAAKIELSAPARIATVCAGRIVMVTTDNREMTIVRAAGRALAAHALDLQGGVVDFVVGIERNQLVIGQLRKLEVWDAVSGRPMRKLAMELPPPPRTIGAAAGHMWVTRPGSDEVFVYRLSDGRPFRHYVGAPVEDVISHPNSPLIVLVTRRGLVRLQCFAHSLLLIESPWQPGAPVPLAQLVNGDDISLLGWPEGALEPWRVAIGGAGAPAIVESAAEAATETQPITAADKLRAMRLSGGGGSSGSDAAATPSYAPAATMTPARASWREALATYGQELARGLDSELPLVAVDTELGELAHRLGLTAPARRAMIALYALYLVGEPAIAIARLARTLGDWTEPLGQGQLGAFAMIDRTQGKVALAREVTDLLDGQPPREVRIVGGTPTTPRAGAFRISRDGRADQAIEAELATQLGRIAVVETARIAAALLEARLHGATAVTMTVPTERPRPWPLGAGLVLVLYGTASAWVADVPAL
jgi:hypothetical protein